MKSQPKTKVMFLITKSNWGGAQRYVYDLATSLPLAEYEVLVALGGSGELKTKLQQANIRTMTLHSMKNETSFLRVYKATKELYTILRSERPTIMHINSSLAGVAGSIAGRLTATPRIIFTAHGWAFNEARPYWQRAIIKFLHWCTVLLSHQTIAVSHALKSQFQWPFVQARMTVIHNAIAPLSFLSRTKARDELLKLLPTLSSYQNDPWGVTIAELHPVKQHDVTICAVASLRDQGIPYRHIIIGGGELEAELVNLIHTLDLTEHVFMTGHQTDAARWLQAFDIFVLSSRSEALGYVLLEALAAQLPIIASNVGGIPEVVPNYPPHTLVASSDVAELGNAIKHTLAKVPVEQVPQPVATLETMTTATMTVYQSPKQ